MYKRSVKKAFITQNTKFPTRKKKVVIFNFSTRAKRIIDYIASKFLHFPVSFVSDNTTNRFCNV